MDKFIEFWNNSGNTLKEIVKKINIIMEADSIEENEKRKVTKF